MTDKPIMVSDLYFFNQLQVLFAHLKKTSITRRLPYNWTISHQVWKNLLIKWSAKG